MKNIATTFIILFYSLTTFSQTTMSFSESNISDCFTDTNNSETYTSLTISGQTFQDFNAMAGGADGIPRGLVNVYAVLVDSDTGLVIDTDLTVEGFDSTDPNTTVGTYSLNGVSNQNYHVILQYYPMAPPAFGDIAPTISNIEEIPDTTYLWQHSSDDLNGEISSNPQDGISLYFNTDNGEDVVGVDFGYYRGIPTNED